MEKEDANVLSGRPIQIAKRSVNRERGSLWESLERPIASFRFWNRVLRTHDKVSNVFDLNHTIGQIPRADVVKGGFEQISLKKRRDIGDNNNDSRMQWLFAEERRKISAIVGYKCKLPLADNWQQLPSLLDLQGPGS